VKIYLFWNKKKLTGLIGAMKIGCLTRIIHQAQKNHLITGLIDHIILDGIAILQYGDDTII
jgi:hypothetical protein